MYHEYILWIEAQNMCPDKAQEFLW
jgi:hypothetical protein